jgi:hypothetical protein
MVGRFGSGRLSRDPKVSSIGLQGRPPSFPGLGPVSARAGLAPGPAEFAISEGAAVRHCGTVVDGP